MIRYRQTTGATLLDLCLALAITAGLMGVSLPAWYELNRLRLVREARALEHRLRGAVITAFASRSTVRVQVSQQAITFHPAFGPPIRHPLHGSLSANLSAADPQYLTIFSQGNTTPGSIYLRTGSTQCRISLALRGRVRRLC